MKPRTVKVISKTGKMYYRCIKGKRMKRKTPDKALFTEEITVDEFIELRLKPLQNPA